METLQQPFRYDGPHRFKNLSVYLVRGADLADTADIVMLDEAIKQRIITVHETGNVHELKVENLSYDKTVFIQAGDIVKGGKQDRTVGYDFFLSPRSGEVPIQAFCVEQSRWHQRGSEPLEEFYAAPCLAVREITVAAIFERSQGKVWENVAKFQNKLSSKLKKPVRATASPTSLQLSLEDSAVKEGGDEYTAALKDLAASAPDSVGFAFAVNGEISSADIYASHSLFESAWPRLLAAAANEALADQPGLRRPGPPAEEAVVEFIRNAEQGAVRPVNGDLPLTIRETERSYFAESAKRPGAHWMHRTYARRQ